MLPLVLVGWVLTLAAVVTGKLWLLVVAAPFLLLAGGYVLANDAAWAALARQATAATPYDDHHRQQLVSSRLLRIGMGGGLLLFGAAWLIAGLLL